LRYRWSEHFGLGDRNAGLKERRLNATSDHVEHEVFVGALDGELIKARQELQHCLRIRATSYHVSGDDQEVWSEDLEIHNAFPTSRTQSGVYSDFLEWSSNDTASDSAVGETDFKGPNAGLRVDGLSNITHQFRLTPEYQSWRIQHFEQVSPEL
jgi:hypothetical protein